MKKDLIIHFSFITSFFLLTALLRGWLDVSYLPFFLGGILGTILPDTDHLIYIYFLRPKEAISQKATELFGKRQVIKAMEFLSRTRSQRTKLIFHTAYFQMLFLALSFLVITSSGSLLGRGIVLAFSLHLLIDSYIDYSSTGSLANWFRDVPITLNKNQEKALFIILFVLLLVFGVFL